MKTIKVLTFGLTLQSDNKGCEALAYSFFYMLNDLLKEKGLRAQVRSVIYVPYGERLERDLSMFDRIELTFLPNRKKSVRAQSAILKAMRTCNLCVDFTDGDSFSDIYGKSRFYWRTLEKMMVLLHGKRMLLGPQTYGPYKDRRVQKWASWVLKKAKYVYARDERSAELVKELTGREIESFTDIALAMPRVEKESLAVGSKRVGINVSALLWNGGYTGNNQFGLTVDYQRYVSSLIEWCGEQGYEVWLIPHVICRRDEVSAEDDLRVCRMLAERYPTCRLVEDTESPMVIKGYIAQMNAFVGARMHSTIGAFSAGVATVPFAYSKKFGDLFGSLDYPYIVDGRILSTEEALRLTEQYIMSDETKKGVERSRALLLEKTKAFSDRLSQIVDEVVENEVCRKKDRG